jgi:SAM-dependent methyltransferase
MAREVVDESTFLAIERQFHDRYADIVDWDEPIGDSLGYEYCEEAEEKVRQLLANVGNLQVLEIGSGHGNSALILAKCGAIVTSIDISPKLIEGCKHRSAVHNLSVDFRVMNACKLEFPDESFDIVTAVRPCIISLMWTPFTMKPNAFSSQRALWCCLSRKNITHSLN